MKAYLVPTAPIGYGPRIFVPYEFHTPEVEKMLKIYSTWGGYDKDTGKCYGYEFPWHHAAGDRISPRFELAKMNLQLGGFKLENQSAENQAKV